MDTDFASLERELRGTSDEDRELPEEIEEADPYADLASRYDDVVTDDDDDEAYGR